jgi:transposase
MTCRRGSSSTSRHAAGWASVFDALVADLRLLLRLQAGRTGQPSAVILDSRTIQSTPESGTRAGYDGHKRRKGSKVYAAVDTLGQLLALHVTPANELDRAQVARLSAAVQEATGEHVTLAFFDQGYAGSEPAAAAEAEGIELHVVKLPTARQGFVLLPRRWVVERSFAWASRFRRLRLSDAPPVHSHLESLTASNKILDASHSGTHHPRNDLLNHACGLLIAIAKLMRTSFTP